MKRNVRGILSPYFPTLGALAAHSITARAHIYSAQQCANEFVPASVYGNTLSFLVLYFKIIIPCISVSHPPNTIRAVVVYRHDFPNYPTETIWIDSCLHHWTKFLRSWFGDGDIDGAGRDDIAGEI
jgi:hypothetical protein